MRFVISTDCNLVYVKFSLNWKTFPLRPEIMIASRFVIIFFLNIGITFANEFELPCGKFALAF